MVTIICDINKWIGELNAYKVRYHSSGLSFWNKWDNFFSAVHVIFLLSQPLELE